MKSTTVLAAFILAGLLLTSCGQYDNVPNDSNQNKVEPAILSSEPNPDVEFVLKAAEGGLIEVKLGQLAKSKGMAEAIKSFGTMMVDDHSKANEELKNLAQKKNIQLSDSLSGEKRERYAEFVRKNAMDFDKDFINLMVDDHKKVIDAFEKEAKDGKDADIKAWASEKLPTLKHHLDMAEQTKNTIAK